MKIGTIRLPAAAYDRDSMGKKRDNWILFGAAKDRLSPRVSRWARNEGENSELEYGGSSRNAANLVSGNSPSLSRFTLLGAASRSATLYSAHYAPADRERSE